MRERIGVVILLASYEYSVVVAGFLMIHRILSISGVATPHFLSSSIHFVGASWPGQSSLLFWLWRLDSMAAKETVLGLVCCLEFSCLL